MGALTALQDQFTSSAQGAPAQATAEAAGLFTVSQFTLFSAAAEFLLAQTAAPPQANPANTPPPAVNPNPGTTAPGVAATNLQAAPQAPLAGAAAPAATTTAAPAPASNLPKVITAGTPSVEDQLQALNNKLSALGLGPADIQKVDQIAGLINDFNPTAFTSLVYQLEAQAQSAARQIAAIPATTATAAPAVGGNTALANNNGQTLPVHAPQQSASANPPTGGTPALAQTRAAQA